MDWYQYIIGGVSIAYSLLILLNDGIGFKPLGVSLLVVGILVLMGYK